MKSLALAVAIAAVEWSSAVPALGQASCPPPPIAPTDSFENSLSPLAGETLELRLNVPAYRLDVYDRGERIRSYRVAVGTPEHPTPLGHFQLSEIVWNPWWIPPPFDWAKDERVTPPGPGNPTGRVKLFFGYYLFMHGTPADSTLGHAASHGCIRMSNSDAIDLARLVMKGMMPEVRPSEIDSLVAHPRATRNYVLKRPVPLTLEYRLAELRDGRLEVHPDVYREGALSAGDVVRMLELEGYDVRKLDNPSFEAFLERGRRGHVTVGVAELLAPRAHPY